MRLDVTLWVSLKGSDLVASTAYFTLAEKMGYAGHLLAIQRLEVYQLAVVTGDPEGSARSLKRLFASGSRFYNRNKHNFFLECRWSGGTLEDGTPLAEIERRLEREAAGRRGAHQDFDGKGAANRVILRNVQVFRTDVLVEDLGRGAKERLARELVTEVPEAAIDVTGLGTCWLLALSAASPDDAETAAREITVTSSRDRGLLLNPNHQGFKILSTEVMLRGE